MSRSPSPFRWSAALALWGAVIVAGCSRDQAAADGPVVVPVAFQRQARVSASLEGGVGWINTAPIRLEDLKGKVVLLDFWTYCCINCHHVLPDLAKLEEKYKNELVVIGVHTAKFFAERDTENIRRKVREYHIKHPVVNDADQKLWERFGVQSWPTLVVIDPAGQVVGAVSGEGHYDVLDREVGKLVREHKAKGDLNETPVKFFPEIEKPDDTALLFPGKVLADAERKRLFIADTGHSRIIQTDLNGQRPVVIGDGTEGLVDGDYNKARFNRPQGMCLVEDTLYVADTENHALRAVDLKKRKVATVAGDGRQTHNFKAHGPGPTTSLTSPWDVASVPALKSLMIAMAGQHQIWRYDLASETVGVWAGSGREDIIDGALASAAFAQPSGLATDGEHLFVADSEVSGVRTIGLTKGRQRVDTIVGVGLFGFDDVDGQGEEVRLQHCLGVAYGNDRLYIADTYNNKIKVCNPEKRTVKTLVGGKAPGDTDDPPRFYQPGGLSSAGSTLYVADTNNHLVRAIDLKTDRVKTVEIEGLKPPAPPRRAPVFPNATITKLPAVEAAPGDVLTFDVKLALPSKAKINEQASMPYLVETTGKTDLLADSTATTISKINPPSAAFSVSVPLAKPAKDGDSLPVKFSVSAFVCDEGSNLCRIQSFVWNVPVTFAKGAPAQVVLTAEKR